MSSVNRNRILIMLFAVAMVASLTYKVLKGVSSTSDFAVFWYSGRALNYSLNPYTLNEAIQVSGIPNFLHFWSPIWVAELMRPFGLLGFHVAKALWTLINLVLFNVVVSIIAKLSSVEMNLENGVLLYAILLSLNSTPYTLGDGQTDFLVLASLATSWLLLSRRKFFLSGAVLCIGAVNPHLIIGTSIYYVFRSIRYKEPQLFLGGLTALGLLVITCAPYLKYVVEWFRTVLPYAQSQGVTDSAGQLTLVNLFYGMHVGEAGIWVFGLSLLALVLAFAIWLTTSDMYIGMGVSTLLTLATSTFTFHQDFLILALVIPMVVRLWNTGASRTVAMVCALSASVLCSGMTGNNITLSHGIFEVFQPLVTFSIMVLVVPSIRHIKPVQGIIITIWIVVTIGGYALCNLYLNQAHTITAVLVLSGVFIALLTITYHSILRQIVQHTRLVHKSLITD